MIVVEGAWLLTMAGEPVRAGRLAIDGGRIVGVGGVLAERDPDVRMPGAILMPGLVNAHTHLELSYLAGAVPPSEAFVPWVSALLATRAGVDEAGSPEVGRAADGAARAMRATGTALAGDVSNTLRTPALMAEHRLAGVVFHELLGFGPADRGAQVRDARARADAVEGPRDVRVSLAPHAPYSVSSALFEAIRDDLADRPDAVSTVHVAEGREEVEFVKSGTGPWRGVLDRLGVWNDAWAAPGKSSIAYLDDLGVFDGRTLAVHGVQADGPDLARLRASGTTLVSCPRSNQWVGAGSPSIDAFYASHVSVAFGTDSLASTPDLNLFAELAEARRLAPRVPARWLLEGATQRGAAALGWGETFGTLEPGKRAAVLAVRLPEGITDPEEYLLGGISAEQVAWVDLDG
jgi:cytosine/adenosine deaminase-related metal-dependent hydrolase